MRPFGLMLHHFFDKNNHPEGQGAISQCDFESLLDYIENNYNLINAEDWMARALSDSLDKKDVCLSFDDGLRCQYDIALPVLQRRGITAFWFVYSSVFNGEVGNLELYRYYRTVSFDNISDFYNGFETQLQDFDFYSDVQERLKGFKSKEYLAEYSIYTDQDRRFRFIRDVALGPDRYEKVMDSMISNGGMDIESLFECLWMDNTCIRELHKLGHVVGLHSYSHPTKLSDLSASEQFEEYRKNYEHIREVIGISPIAASHPCGSYNKDTLGILRELGVKLGFCSNMLQKTSSLLELPREDHSSIMKKLRS